MLLILYVQIPFELRCWIGWSARMLLEIWSAEADFSVTFSGGSNIASLYLLMRMLASMFGFLYISDFVVRPSCILCLCDDHCLWGMQCCLTGLHICCRIGSIGVTCLIWQFCWSSLFWQFLKFCYFWRTSCVWSLTVIQSIDHGGVRGTHACIA